MRHFFNTSEAHLTVTSPNPRSIFSLLHYFVFLFFRHRGNLIEYWLHLGE